MMTSGTLGNAANFVTIVGGVLAALVFAWRVISRLNEITGLLRDAVAQKPRIDNHESRLSALETWRGQFDRRLT